jgi:putative restriction endonuclease
MAFGEIAGNPVGTNYPDRNALREAGVHWLNQAGIGWRADEDSAESIVLNEGYEDDRDLGDEILYTGHGGRDPNSGRQIADQQFTAGNKALAANKTLAVPVRVIRGYRLKSPFAPPTGYRYDGLYYVDDVWHDTGQAGYLIWRFRLLRADDAALPVPAPTGAIPDLPTARSAETVQRIVRSTVTALKVKQLYNYRCQVCGLVLVTPAGLYAEAAHIRPLGRPHDGPDVESNILCLCPNHHVLFDSGAIGVAANLTLLGGTGRLHVDDNHGLDAMQLAYHREHYWRD